MAAASQPCQHNIAEGILRDHFFEIADGVIRVFQDTATCPQLLKEPYMAVDRRGFPRSSRELQSWGSVAPSVEERRSNLFTLLHYLNIAIWDSGHMPDKGQWARPYLKVQ